MKHLKHNIPKSDFFRYETFKETNMMRSILYCNEQMKEKYLVYNDMVVLCPCYKVLNNNNRFEL
jgi:choline kinase